MSLLLEDQEKPALDALLAGTACNATDFIFKDGVFYATFEGHLHPRKSAAELYDHLNYKPPLPVITDTGRTWPAPLSKYTNYKPDFYSAQLLHYGLKPLKTKGPAKKKLLAAFGGPEGKTLDVPKAILELEEVLRELWHKSNPGGRVEQKAGSKISKGRPLQLHVFVSSLKPAVINTAPKIKQSATIGVPSASSSKPLQVNPLPKTEQTIKTEFSSLAGIPAPTQIPRTKQTARKTTTGSRIPSVRREPSPPQFRTRQTAVHGLGRYASVIPRERIKKLRKAETSPDMTKAEMRTAIKSLKADQARQILSVLLDKLPTGQNVIAKELSLTMKNPPNSKPTPVDPSEWTGLYDIESPTIESECDRLNYTFEVYTSSTSSHLWAEFDFGVVSGVMRSVYPPPNSFDTEVYFEWRGRDSSENVMTFDRDNRAIITFLPDGLLEGKVCAGCYGTFKIYGSIQVMHNFAKVTRKTEEQQRQEVRSWKDEWRYLNDHNYDVERIARWGKWGGDTKEEQAFESDTTAGRKKRSWKIDIANFMKDPNHDSEEWDNASEEDSEDDDEW